MRRLLFIAAVAFTVQLTLVGAASAAPPVVNPKLAKLQETVAKDMMENSFNLDHAATVSAELLKADPDNAFSHYAAAGLAAWHEKWEIVQAEVDAGNKSPYAVQYQRVAGPAGVFLLNVTCREIARAAAGGAVKMGPEKAVPLLQSIRTLTRKLAWSEPRSYITYLTAVSSRSIADTGFVNLTTPGTPEAAQAQKALDADRAFAKSASEDVKKTFGENTRDFFVAAVEKQKLTVEQVEAYHNGAKVTPTIRTKILAVKKEIDAVERPWVARWLKKLPE